MFPLPPRRCLRLSILALALATPALADTVTWISPTSGLWTTTANWSSDPALPDPTSDVIINQPTAPIVTLSSGNQSINSLLVDNALVLSGGSLAVATTAQVAGQLTLAGGTLQNATLSSLSPGNITLPSGTLSNVTLASNISLTNPALTLTSNLTLSNFTITLTATTAATLTFAGNETLAGTGTLVFNGTRSSTFAGSTANLTIAPGISLVTGSASATIGVGTLLNQGAIVAQISGKIVAINSHTFTNAGSLQASNGGTLTINSSSWTSPGTIAVDATSTLNLGGAFAPAALASITNAGGTINITGILDNSNNTLALATPAATYTVLGGTIKNGNVSLASGGTITIASSGNVTLASLTVAPGGQLLQTAGTLAVPAIIQSGGTISLGGTQSTYTLTALAITAGTTTLTNDSAKTLVTPALTLGGSAGNWTGRLELGANKLIVQPTAPTKADALAALQDQVLYGTTHAAGITSASLPPSLAVAVVDNAALATPFTTFAGQPVTTASLLVAPELLGDTDLSGTVDLNDLNDVLNHLGKTTPAWTDGNFDGAPTIDLNDLNAVLNNLGVSYASGTTLAAAQAPAVTASPTPEPASLALLSAALLSLAFRRSRSVV